MIRLLPIALLLALPAGAGSVDTPTRIYDCERGAVVHAAYLAPDGAAHAVIAAEGRQLVLEIQPAASGARYVTTGGQPLHVWWTKGETASLYAGPEEVAIYTECVARPTAG